MAKSGYLIEFQNQAGTSMKKAKSLYWYVLGTNLVKNPCTATLPLKQSISKHLGE